MYDDYKFVTTEELNELGLEHLIGSPLLRAHLHGFFIDIRLYRKAASARPASATETVKKEMVGYTLAVEWTFLQLLIVGEETD